MTRVEEILLLAADWRNSSIYRNKKILLAWSFFEYAFWSYGKIDFSPPNASAFSFGYGDKYMGNIPFQATSSLVALTGQCLTSKVSQTGQIRIQTFTEKNHDITLAIHAPKASPALQSHIK